MSNVFTDIMRRQENFNKKDIVTEEIKHTPEHKELVKIANEEIRKGKIRRAEAYESAKNYFSS